MGFKGSYTIGGRQYGDPRTNGAGKQPLQASYRGKLKRFCPPTPQTMQHLRQKVGKLDVRAKSINTREIPLYNPQRRLVLQK
jgi:hypothetical protein